MLLTYFLALCGLLLVFGWLMMPGESSAEQRAPFWGTNIAHRGLHSSDTAIPENSIAAFTAAIDAGYGCELDIQLSRDGEVVVFHDDDLLRLCGVARRVDALDWSELQALRILDTDQGIPLLSDVLDLVGGQVPLVIELKTCPNNRRLCQSAWRILRTYDGDICIESFDPRIVRWFKRHVPGLLRGQLASPPGKMGNKLLGAFIGLGFSHFLGRPHFIAYQKGDRPFTIRLCQRFCMSVVWTATSEPEGDTLELDNDAVIFEHYLPDPRYAIAPGTPESWPEGEDYRF